MTTPSTLARPIDNCTKGVSDPTKVGGAVEGPCQSDAPFALLPENMGNISGGATIWARQTIESDIFFSKPDKWFKIWFYIVNKVKFADSKRFKRGENFIKYEWISDATGATKNQIKHFIEWAKTTQMLATRKATRGMIVNVLKYEVYQDLGSYESHTKRNLKGTQKEHRSHTILKNVKNDKNDKEEILPRPDIFLTGQFEEFWKAYPKKEGKKKSGGIWINKNLDSVLPVILAFIEKAKQTERWQKDGGKFIQAPTTFLNGETWNDDVTAYGNGTMSNDPVMNKAIEIAAKARADWPNDPDQARLDGINRLCEYLGIGDCDPQRFEKVKQYTKILGY